LADPLELARQKELARRRANVFATQPVVDRYEALYRRLLDNPPQ
jgi:hypothetical protein